MKKNRVYTVNSLLARISGNYKFWLIALPAVTMLAQAPAVYAHAETITVVQQNNATVRGSVKDATGESLIGVSVTVKGKEGVGTITDVDGNYSIVCSAQDVLVFSYVGYATQEIAVKNQKQLNVVLKEDTKVLDEVIVIGYGTTTRKSAVGAVDQVKASMIEDRPVANMTDALQGAAPNVVIQQRSSNPNDRKTNFNIRGISTVNDNSPLFVIDGLVADGGSFDKLNPNDIENISILKDAGTAAIYGSRSSNGVVLVTTKKGKEEPACDSSVKWYDGMAESGYLVFSGDEGYQNATLRNLAATNAGEAPLYTPDQIRDLAAHQNEESWFFDQIVRTALQQNYNLSVSGGSDKTTYMVSMGYYDQESNYVGNSDFGVQRYNFRTNVSTEVGRLKLNAILAYTRNNSVSTTGGSLEVDAARVPTYYYYKMKSEDGRYLLNDVLTEFNPLGALEAGGRNKYRNNYLNANVNAEFRLIDGLKLRGVLGADVINDMRSTRNLGVSYYLNEEATEPRPVKDTDYRTSNWNHTAYLINSQLLLDYNKTFGKHNVSGLFGVTNESFTSSSNEIEKKGVDPDLGIGTDITNSTVGNITGKTFVDESNRTSLTSLLGRVGHSYADRYYTEFSFRYDASSKFHKDYRWGFFPSVSLGWRLSEENFMQAYKERVGDLKLRTSFGILGNQSIGMTVLLFTNCTTTLTHTTTRQYQAQVLKLGKDNLTWEKTKTFNVGVDALRSSITL